MAAAAAVTGRLADVRALVPRRASRLPGGGDAELDAFREQAVPSAGAVVNAGGGGVAAAPRASRVHDAPGVPRRSTSRTSTRT